MNILKTFITRATSLMLMAGVAFLMVSCGASKKVTEGQGPVAVPSFSATKHLETVVSNKSTANAVTAKVKVKVGMSGKDIGTSGTLRMKRGEVVQLSLLDPILGITEVMRMEFSRDRVLIVDRLNRRYVDEPYSRISYFSKANLDFSALESLFWNEVFLPEKKKVVTNDFVFDAAKPDVVSMSFDDELLEYKFITDEKTGKLRNTQIRTLSGSYTFNLDYEDFKTFEGKDFPCTENLGFTYGGKKLTLMLRMSSLRADSDWESETSVSKKYTKISVNSILNSLMGR